MDKHAGIKISTQPKACIFPYATTHKIIIADDGEIKITSQNHSSTLTYSQIRKLKSTQGMILHGWHGLEFSDDEGVLHVVNGLTSKDAHDMYIFVQEKRGIALQTQLRSVINKVKNEFTSLFNSEQYLDYLKSSTWYDKHKHFKKYIDTRLPLDINELNLQDKFRSDLNNVLNLLKLDNFRKDVTKHNAQFVNGELKRCKEFFDTVEEFPLTQQQRVAILHDEINNLIIAGAGTGKTSTLMGKVGYILEKGLASPEEILVLAFTKKAAEEIGQRIKHKFNKDINVSTFHSLGMQIIASQGEKPTLSKLDEDKKASEDFFFDCVKELFSVAVFGPTLMKFFNEYLIPRKSAFSFENLREYIAYLINFEIRTLKGEKVKSYQECMIANFFFRNQIEYIYEKPYEHKTVTAERKQYKPDFFLTDYKIYIEHFGINRENKTAPFIDNEKYIKSIEWKRKLHQEKKTQLVETYSYDFSERKIFEKLKIKLTELGVKFKPLNDQEMFNKLKDVGYTNRLTSLLSRFMTLFKSKKESIDSIRQKAEKMSDTQRAIIFISIFSRIYEMYESRLKENDEIDFNDMIIHATSLVEEGKYVSPYKYLLVDEFQDISFSRYMLLKTIQKQNPSQKLVCVGDDWQSIYRFTGADMSIMTDFAEHFGYTKTSKLEKTFRFNKSILNVSNKFITRNPFQITKQLYADSNSISEAVIVNYVAPENLEKVLPTVLKEINEDCDAQNASVMLLGRYNHDEPKVLGSLKREFKNFNILFLTVHKAKGLQADYVIVTNMTSGKYGFPSEISDDPLLNLVMVKPDSFTNAEERRLFYVALTRARKKVFIITNSHSPSAFAVELAQDDYKVEIRQGVNGTQPIFCPCCKSGTMLIRNGEFGRFVSCSNYPYCEEKGIICTECGGIMVKDISVMKFLCSSDKCGNVIPICEKCGNRMTLRNRKTDGKPFWGCKSFPECKFTIDIPTLK